MPNIISPSLLMISPFLFGMLPIHALAETDKGRQPNIILINTDDLGYADLGCYGNEYHETPQIDALVTQGIRFT